MEMYSQNPLKRNDPINIIISVIDAGPGATPSLVGVGSAIQINPLLLLECEDV